MKPARDTIKRRTPRTMTGHWRNLTHVSAGSFVSQIPAAMIGMERITARRFMNPMMLLLIAMFVGGDFRDGVGFGVCFKDGEK